MFAKLWHRFRASQDDYEQRKDEAAIEESALEREEHERSKGEPVDLPPGRSNADWGMPPG